MVTRTFDEEETFPSFDEPATKIRNTKLPTVLSQLTAELGKPADVEKDITLKVAARPKISLKFSTDLPLVKLDRWRISARKNPKRDDIDIILFNQLIIGSQNIGVLFDGEEVLDANGDPITVKDQTFIDSLNALDYKGAIKELFVRDSDILRVGAELVKAAGYDDEDDEADPLD